MELRVSIISVKYDLAFVAFEYLGSGNIILKVINSSCRENTENKLREGGLNYHNI